MKTKINTVLSANAARQCVDQVIFRDLDGDEITLVDSDDHEGLFVISGCYATLDDIGRIGLALVEFHENEKAACEEEKK